MNHFYKTIQNWFDYESVYDMIVKNAEENSHFVEIGVWKGGSTSYMGVEIVNSNKKIKFDAIDTFEGSKEHGEVKGLYEEAKENLKPLLDLGIVNLIRGKSLDIVNTYSDSSLDFCFIDGSHEYEDVKRDIMAYLPKMKSGSILAGHDYDVAWSGVIRAVDEVLGKENISTIKSAWIYKVK